MKERNKRLRAIKKIIKENRVDSQETLLQFLLKESFALTQATLSRDLKLLKVGKVSEGQNGYYYTLPGDDSRKDSEDSYIEDFMRGYIGIDFSGNLGVIRTLPGHAGSVALSIDCLGMDDILGSVAGDDTILIVLREGITGKKLMEQLQERIPELED